MTPIDLAKDQGDIIQILEIRKVEVLPDDTLLYTCQKFDRSKESEEPILNSQSSHHSAKQSF